MVMGFRTSRPPGVVSISLKAPLCRAGLTAERKRAALQLADVGGELNEHKLRVTVTKHADDLEELDKALRTLAEVAPMLDTESTE